MFRGNRVKILHGPIVNPRDHFSI